MVANDLVDHEAQEFLAELRVQIGFGRQAAQAVYLFTLAGRIGGGQGGAGLVPADRLGDAEPFGQHVDQRGVDVVDALAIAGQHRVAVSRIGRVGHRTAG